MIFLVLLLMNCITEYQFNKIMLRMNVLEKKNGIFHSLCAVLRITWIYLCAWFAVPMPVLFIGLLVLLFLNVIPYHSRTLLMNNFTMLIYLIYISLLLMVIGCAGLLGVNMEYLEEDILLRVVVMNVTFMIFNVICFFLLRFYPEFLWKEDYDRFKVVIYTRFLTVCVVYHILDSVLLTLYHTSWINYLLLVSGDILILILMLNFLNCNYVFAKSEEMKKEYEESQVLIAQQYFEKERLKKLSEFDSLTNTYNRREISTIMLDNIQKGHKLACVFIDLDGLKRINDKYGHTLGDQMLKRFADACFKILKDKGCLARIGGDEFLLVFIGQEIDYVESCIRELEAKLLEPADEKDKIRFSYGISYDEESVDKYIISADERMYLCKRRKQSGDK